MKYRVKRHAVVQPPDQSIRLIPLTKGINTVVDASDYEWLMQWNWHAHWNKSTKSYYASRTSENIMMHAAIMRTAGEIDHADGDTLNNRRSNLRPCNRTQNIANRTFEKRARKAKSGYKGVHAKGDRWQAFIKAYGKQHCLGTFDNPERAACAYDFAAIQYFGEFAHLNFAYASTSAS